MNVSWAPSFLKSSLPLFPCLSQAPHLSEQPPITFHCPLRLLISSSPSVLWGGKLLKQLCLQQWSLDHQDEYPHHHPQCHKEADFQGKEAPTHWKLVQGDSYPVTTTLTWSSQQPWTFNIFMLKSALLFGARLFSLCSLYFIVSNSRGFTFTRTGGC